MDTIRLGARLRAARKAAGFKTSKAFLNKYNIPASTYSQHESGSRIPDDETLKYYSKLFDVNFDWLKSGMGNPFSTSIPSKKNIISEELLDIKKTKEKKDKLFIDQKIFTKILESIIDTQLQSKKNKPNPSIIVKDTFEIYSKVMNSNKLSQLKIIKSELILYKKKQKQ